MKIKTITCHKVYNHGASLQEYALLKYLNTIGHDVETINYRPDYLSNHFNLLDVSNPRYNKNVFIKIIYLLAKLPKRLISLKRKIAFDQFEKKHITSGQKKYNSNEELKDDLPIADAYICGSDQIWNSFFQNGKDPAFYLDFVPSDKLKISYAASFAIDKLEETIKLFVKEKIERINKISVREKSGIKILNDLKITNVEQVLDPVFLLNAQYWKDTFIRPIKNKYIFVYDFDSSEQIEKIAKLTAKQYGLKIFTVNQNIKYADKNFFFSGPDTFLSLIYSSEFIITNSFHAVAFSLIFNKIFLVFDRKEKINTRMRDLMNFIELSRLHLAKDGFKLFDNVKIDYQKVNGLLKIKTKESQLFLKNALTNTVS